MSLPETTVYGGAIPATAAANNLSMVKARPGRYVLASLAVDQMCHLDCSAGLRKDGTLDFTVKFVSERNSTDPVSGQPKEGMPDRQASVWVKCAAPLSTFSGDGRFTQAELALFIRSMAAYLAQPNIVEQIIRQEQ